MKFSAIKHSLFVNTANAEEHLIGAFPPKKPAVQARSAATSQPALSDEGPMPDLGGAIGCLRRNRHRGGVPGEQCIGALAKCGLQSSKSDF